LVPIEEVRTAQHINGNLLPEDLGRDREVCFDGGNDLAFVYFNRVLIELCLDNLRVEGGRFDFRVVLFQLSALR
jgi:hypothetical protein